MLVERISTRVPSTVLMGVRFSGDGRVFKLTGGGGGLTVGRSTLVGRFSTLE